MNEPEDKIAKEVYALASRVLDELADADAPAALSAMVLAAATLIHAVGVRPSVFAVRVVHWHGKIAAAVAHEEAGPS